MKKEREEIKKIIVENYYCDICGDKAEDSWGNPYICRICHRNICNKHLIRDDSWDSGDYPDKYCKNCWDIGKKYRDEIEKIKESSEAEADKKNEEWYQKAIKDLKENK